MATSLTKTNTTATNRKKFTFSCWLKRGKLGTQENFFTSIHNASNEFQFRFDSDDELRWVGSIGGSAAGLLNTKRVFRDISAWYHIVIAGDTTQATNINRLKLYINGTQIADGDFNSPGYPGQDTNFGFGTSDFNFCFGVTTPGTTNDPFTGVISHAHFIDGTAYDASTFGETDSTSGIWKPKTAPSVTYGNNGFFLKFENSGAMGTDSSGQSNTFTVSGTLTQNVDTPTNNYPTLNPLAPSQDNRTGGNGNLYTGGNSNNSWSSHPATMACESGKWYFEIKDESDWGSTSDSTRRYGIVNLGVSVNQARASATDVRFSDATSGYAYMNASGVRNGGSTIGGSTGTHPTFAEGDFIMVAMDLDNNKLYFGKNGTWLDSGNPASGASGTGAVATLAAGAWAAYLEVKYGSDTASINFGQGYFRTASAGSNADANGHGKFKYTVPSGYYAICTKNIKEFG